MEEVQKYYRQKAHIEVKDKYYETIMEGDLDLLRKSFAYVMVSPFLAVFIMYVAKEVKREYSISDRIQSQARSMQDTIVTRTSGYKRSRNPKTTMMAQNTKEELKEEADNLRSLYDAIKEDE